MSARESAIVTELEQQRAFLGTRAASLAGDAAELKAALQASEAKAKALQAELDEMKKAAESEPGDYDALMKAP